MIKIWPIFVIATFFIVIFSISYFFISLGAASNIPLQKEVEIKTGEGFNLIAVQLKNEGLVKSISVFKAYAILSGYAHLLKPGSYMIDAASSTPEIIKLLVRGPRDEIRVVIPEGLTLRDIDLKLSSLEIIPRGALELFDINEVKNDYEFLQSVKDLEGYLYPDTYKLFKNSETITVVKKLLSNFNQKAWPVLKDKQIKAGHYTLGPAELLIVASIIEKEVPNVGKDRNLVAGVMYKRLKLGMPLQSDATVVYEKCHGYFLSCEQLNLYRRDLTLKSLYNTYINTGLPPGPISNPGLSSVTAAVNPQSSDFLYYLSDPKTKGTIFSKTLDEHNQNSVKYLNI